MSRSLLVLAALGASPSIGLAQPAAHSQALVNAPPEPAAEAAAEPAESASSRPPRQRRYAIGLGIDSTRFRTLDEAQFVMMGPALHVDYSVGRRLRFAVRGEFMFPMHGRLSNTEATGDGQSFALGQYYDARRRSFDLTIGIEHAFQLGDGGIELAIGAGAHTKLAGLVSKKYVPIELITGGIGGWLRLEVPINDHFFYGGELAAALDPVDFIRHRNPVMVLAPMSLSFVVGARR